MRLMRFIINYLIFCMKKNLIYLTAEEVFSIEYSGCPKIFRIIPISNLTMIYYIYPVHACTQGQYNSHILIKKWCE